MAFFECDRCGGAIGLYCRCPSGPAFPPVATPRAQEPDTPGSRAVQTPRGSVHEQVGTPPPMRIGTPAPPRVGAPEPSRLAIGDPVRQAERELFEAIPRLQQVRTELAIYRPGGAKLLGLADQLAALKAQIAKAETTLRAAAVPRARES